MNSSRHAAGFTLIEVLVALIIVAFGMSAVLSALGSAATTTAALREKAIAEWIALNHIAVARLALQAPASGNTDGDVQFAGSKWHWQQSVMDLQEQIGVPGIRSITVQVRREAATDAARAKQTDWVATVVGFRGNALANSSGELPDWNGASFVPGTGTGGVPGAPGGVVSPGVGTPGALAPGGGN